MDTALPENGNFCYVERSLRDADVDQGFDFEAITPTHLRRFLSGMTAGIQGDDRKAFTPESVVSIAKVGITSAVEQIYNLIEPIVADSPDPADTTTAATLYEAGALGEVCSVFEGIYESSNLGRSFEPSASSTTMKSPDAASKPQAKALPLPFRD